MSVCSPLNVSRALLTQFRAVPMGVLSVLPGGPEVGKQLVSNPIIRKVDITAGTSTGRQLGGIVGSNLASFTAELGGKVCKTAYGMRGRLLTELKGTNRSIRRC